jgi:hypothetical protein
VLEEDDGELEGGEAWRWGGRCDTAAKAPPHCRAVVVSIELEAQRPTPVIDGARGGCGTDSGRRCDEVVRAPPEPHVAGGGGHGRSGG